MLAWPVHATGPRGELPAGPGPAQPHTAPPRLLFTSSPDVTLFTSLIFEQETCGHLARGAEADACYTGQAEAA